MSELAQACKAWYDNLPDEESYARRCVMYVPKDIKGLRALDVNCRNGKGVYKLAEAVGQEGFALGTLMGEEALAQAEAGVADGLARAGLTQRNLDFVQAYPEDLSQAAEDASFDVVYLNSSVNIAYDPKQVLAEAWRALVSQGRMIYAAVLADVPRNPEVQEAARRLANCVQAAPFEQELLDCLAELGFSSIQVENQGPITCEAGVVEETIVPCVEASEEVNFFMALVTAVKA